MDIAFQDIGSHGDESDIAREVELPSRQRPEEMGEWRGALRARAASGRRSEAHSEALFRLVK